MNENATTSCLGALLFLFATVLFFALLVMIAWNLVVPTLVGGPSINYLQAFGISLMLTIVRGIFATTITTRR